MILVLLMTVIGLVRISIIKLQSIFLLRKGYKQVLQVKKELKDLNTGDLDLPKDTNIFVSQSLCPYYRILWSKSKRLHSMGIIKNYLFQEEP